MKSIMRFIIVSLIGIPASGKSTISMKIHKLSKENLLNTNVIVLNFDKLIQIDFENITDGDYKKSREVCFNKIENLIGKLKTEMISNWMTIIASNELKIPQNSISLSSENPMTLLIIDDNMYYRSMRQRTRQICRACDCKHFQIFMKSSLADAIARNSKRCSNVGNAVIEKMFNDLEEPQNPRTIFMEIENFDEGKFLAELKDRIDNPEVLTEEHQKEPREQSIIHEMDLITRKEIGSKMQEAKGKKKMKEYSEKLNLMRKTFMEDVRSGKMIFETAEDLRDEFRKFIDAD
ncbi:L-seryl-tRNA(Sec) kinase [Chironomus tepperi]|uniref:L-seryl-tRNA(Sec) kinase n=1 Tax=Chironomus tepperi TaxID=113505 RepID=UPI00391F7F64